MSKEEEEYYNGALLCEICLEDSSPNTFCYSQVSQGLAYHSCSISESYFVLAVYRNKKLTVEEENEEKSSISIAVVHDVDTSESGQNNKP
jgi:hypothetical protein